MKQMNLAVILARDLAERIAAAAFVVDAAGRLVYFNESAGELLGRSYPDVGPMSMDEWSTAFGPMRAHGRELTPQDLPLVRSLGDGQAHHLAFSIQGLDGVERSLEVTAVPLFARADELAGAVAFFWQGASR